MNTAEANKVTQEPTPDEIAYSRDDVARLARSQRSLIGFVTAAFLANIAFLFVGGCLTREAQQIVPLALFFCEMLWGGYATYELDRALKSQAAMSWVAAVIAGLFAIFIVGLVVMLLISSRASRVLRREGLRVGFMGVKDQAIKDWLASQAR